MATSTAEKSKVYTISLSPELAQRVEALAKRDKRTVSELFRDAFQSYSAQQARTTLEEFGEYAASRNPEAYGEADVAQLIKDVRANKSNRSSRSNG